MDCNPEQIVAKTWIQQFDELYPQTPTGNSLEIQFSFLANFHFLT
jgi:hypothetical protein